jgi:ubiquinone/menaquinone biosynthesis C-methylase UbiE
MTSVVGTLHGKFVFGRRTRVLAERLSALLPAGATILDVGCGDGLIDALIASTRPDITIGGIDVMVRPQPHIPVVPFDGSVIPYPDNSFDVVMFVDVLHHTNDPNVLLREAKRVARTLVVIKDHTMNGFLAHARLRFMDWVGNAHHGVVLPYNYWPEAKWRYAFSKMPMPILQWQGELGLYPFPASSIFGGTLHFIAAVDAR